MREYFFGKDGSTIWKKEQLCGSKKYFHYDCDIRDQKELSKIYSKYSKEIKLIIHAAATLI